MPPSVAGPGRPAIYALIGSPIAQSLSPAIHMAAFEALELDARYVAVNVVPRDLTHAFPSLRLRFAGLNVTRPLKEAIVPLLDRASPKVDRTGSVNTVVMVGGEAVGHSTDGAGFLAALARAADASPRRALILGTGGAARAVAAALIDEGTAVTVAGRSEAAGRRLAGDLGTGFVPFAFDGPSGAVSETLDTADLVVNATPLGASPFLELCPLPPDAGLSPGQIVCDLVYRPRRTPLLLFAEAAGCRTVEGLDMLIEQGARSFALWTGLEPPLRAMRAAAYRAVGRRPMGAPPTREGSPG
jgi:shikimate dehydrogenase